MIRSLRRRFEKHETGQALPLFGLTVLVLLGFVAMSIDVGRYVWARTSMQAGVDAAAIAAAQDMPDWAGAQTTAGTYWVDNSAFIQSQGQNVQFQVTQVPGNKRLRVQGDADIPTWFARLFGVDHWHVSASGDAESQVLDIAVVMDISGSMCKHPALPSFQEVEKGNALMSPGRLTPVGGSFPTLAVAIPAGGTNSITITLNDVRIFASTNASNNNTNFGTSWNSTTAYWNKTIGSGGSLIRPGIILIGNAAGGYELFQITAAPNTGSNTMVVTRAISNNKTGAATAKTAHAIGSEVWANRYTGPNGSYYCQAVSKYNPTTSQNGPAEPFDSAINNAKYFVSLFNPSYDKIGIATISTDGAINQNLTGGSFSPINSALDAILYPDGSTNIAHGIARAMSILDGAGKRANAVRVMVVLTDGIPNQSCSSGYTSSSCANVTSSPDPSSCPYSSNAAISAAISQAAVAKAGQVKVYTIGLGAGVLDCILTDIATAGGGIYYKAPTPAQLDDAFAAIAAQTHIALVK
ncbi:MAG: VWA domain-containing protein [bacterium]